MCMHVLFVSCERVDSNRFIVRRYEAALPAHENRVTALVYVFMYAHMFISMYACERIHAVHT
jgi:hypothetical protein